MQAFREPYLVLSAALLAFPSHAPAQQRDLQSAPAAPARFRDCAECPEMVVLPPGSFIMGSSPAEKTWAAANGASPASVADEAPRHEVSLRSFALGEYDVTRGEYAAFVRATGYSAGDGCGHDGAKWIKHPNVTWQQPGFLQSDREPVVCVSWNDARAYVKWLNDSTHRAASESRTLAYRLPSESEWEYAARAGTSTRFWWGDNANAAATHAWYATNAGGRTHEAGSKRPNAFGLFDMSGNVWQWTEDCYADSYARAPLDGSASESNTRCLRVDRGSSWFYPAWMLRPATRERNPPDYRDIMLGFRVARSVQPTPAAPPPDRRALRDARAPDTQRLRRP